jgi:hypothetical protein
MIIDIPVIIEMKIKHEKTEKKKKLEKTWLFLFKTEIKVLIKGIENNILSDLYFYLNNDDINNVSLIRIDENNIYINLSEEDIDNVWIKEINLTLEKISNKINEDYNYFNNIKFIAKIDYKGELNGK